MRTIENSLLCYRLKEIKIMRAMSKETMDGQH